MFTNSKEIILASGSPRRQAYFKDLGLFFRVVPALIEEVCAPSEKVVHYIERLAKEKAEYVASRYPNQWIVAADTVVCLGDVLLEKPINRDDAIRMLLALSGMEHTVRTALCFRHKTQAVNKVLTVNTQVLFWNFNEHTAISYVDSGESMDKAGSYAIQGKGAFLVREIHGSYSNVVGLPLYELVEKLKEFKLIAD